jgi:DMSO/TMAO reductase YedYZ molybdopterin-dependent catalytic subunit
MSTPFRSHDVPGVAAPENRPTPVATLVGDVTPVAAHYRRNHFPYPRIDGDSWRLSVTGAVRTPLSLVLADLGTQPARGATALLAPPAPPTCPPLPATVLLECAGHRRTDFQPPIAGVQWSLGALSQAQWGGIALASVLDDAGLQDDAVEVVFHGADAGSFGELPGRHTFSRSIPVAKALHADTMLVTSMNGQPLPREHGFPLRAVVPGWYAMDSVKWITGIEVVTESFRGPFQELDYRFQAVDDPGIGERIDEMRVHALFASVAEGDQVVAGDVTVSGIAWAGAGVETVEIRVDNDDWAPATVTKSGPYERVLWTAIVALPPGQRILSVRATDVQGRTQPPLPIWNRRGYVNNSVQRIAVAAV